VLPAQVRIKFTFVLAKREATIYLPLFLLLVLSCVSQMHCGCTPSRRTNLEGQPRLILVSSQQGHCEMQDCQRVQRAIGVLCITLLIV
jgi:hypothetical protein